MVKKALTATWRMLSPTWLTGPILGKELRVSARRRRSYALRSLYTAGLLAFVAGVWVSEVPYGRGAGVAQVTRMSEAGKTIVMTVVWFQFCAAGLLAIVLPSTAVGEEVYRRTLGVLMTTPITALQIVLGKLASRMWQVLTLVAISLPVLAVVRVFGGVPWDYVVAGLCLTLATALFLASVSLLFSVFNRHAYVVIVATLLTGGLLFGLGALGAVYVMAELLDMSESEGMPLLALGNPMASLAVLTEQLERPPRYASNWAPCCTVLLGASAVVLAASVGLVRRVALRQMIGGGRADDDGPASQAGGVPWGRRIRRIHGPPMLWKELRQPVLRRWRWRIGLAAGAVVILLITYGICAAENALDDDDVQIGCVVTLLCLGLLVTAVVSATSITGEKESRCWPLLLATPLPSRSIVAAKAAGVARRVAPVWALLAGHVVLFTLAGYLEGVLMVQLALIVFYSATFLIGTGIYLSARCRRTTTAVVLNVGLAGFVWGGVPTLAALVEDVTRPGPLVDVDDVAAVNPVVQAVVVTDHASDRWRWTHAYGDGRVVRSRPYAYWWPHGSEDAKGTHGIILMSLVGHVLVGLIYARRAGARFRRKVF